MTNAYTESLNRLIEEFGKLPGVGPKTAERLAFHILRANPNEAMALAKAIGDVKNKIKRCEICPTPAEIRV
jgi:recombination protein RecR